MINVSKYLGSVRKRVVRVCACVLDGDGRSELVVGYTDRVVRAFRWEEPPDATDLTDGQLILLKKWLLEGQVRVHTPHRFSFDCLMN